MTPLMRLLQFRGRAPHGAELVWGEILNKAVLFCPITMIKPRRR